MPEPNFLIKLKAKWGISNNWQILIICIVFSITGSASIWVGSPILAYFGITKEMSPWIYYPLKIIIIFPVYQILLIIFGTMFGQFKFFWAMEKKMFGRFFPNKVKA
jgi:manganese efflux pump family protein